MAHYVENNQHILVQDVSTALYKEISRIYVDPAINVQIGNPVDEDTDELVDQHGNVIGIHVYSDFGDGMYENWYYLNPNIRHVKIFE